jgi:aryl-alcohol dehydrogenase-like predicted oxidoreductase
MGGRQPPFSCRGIKMEQTVFGSTNLSVGRTGFGCIPIQRITFDESTALLRKAYDNGVTLYDTATSYTNSEERIGAALGDVRKNIVICTKSSASNPAKLTENIDNSLKMMKTDYIDVFQFHNPKSMPQPGGADGLYDCLLEAKRQGKVRHIGISSHSRDAAEEAVRSGLYEVLQYPLSYLSTDDEVGLAALCKEKNVGFLAMKAMCGGLLKNAKAAFVFLRQFENVVPIWGIQFMEELDEFLRYEKNVPLMDGEMIKQIETDKAELQGNFCRSCGYCMPCPVKIPIPNAARITFLLGRTAKHKFLTDEWVDNMRRVDECTACGACVARCPYGIDVPAQLKRQQKGFFEIYDAENR